MSTFLVSRYIVYLSPINGDKCVNKVILFPKNVENNFYLNAANVSN